MKATKRCLGVSKQHLLLFECDRRSIGAQSGLGVEENVQSALPGEW